MGTWRYASDRSKLTAKSPGWMEAWTFRAVSILKVGGLMNLLRRLRSITGRHFPFFLGTRNRIEKKPGGQGWGVILTAFLARRESTSWRRACALLESWGTFVQIGDEDRGGGTEGNPDPFARYCEDPLVGDSGPPARSEGGQSRPHWCLVHWQKVIDHHIWYCFF